MKKLKVGDRMVVMTNDASFHREGTLWTVQDPDGDDTHHVLISRNNAAIAKNTVLIIGLTDKRRNSFPVWKIVDEETTS